MPLLTASVVDDVVARALHEDAPWGDLALRGARTAVGHRDGELVAREPGTFAGGAAIDAAFRLADPAIAAELLVVDGEMFDGGARLARVSGPAAGVLQAERIALNFAQRMSGIATATAAYVAAVASTGARIADTRKTTPGLRAFERHAVRCGGGHNHRFSLSDAVMVKDNHLAVLIAAGVDVTDALRGIRDRVPHTTTIEVEVDLLDQLEPVLAAGVDVVMLDNFSLEDLRAGVELVAGRAVVEASGNVRLDTVRAIAETGVDVISVGALTHSVRSLDLGLDIRVAWMGLYLDAAATTPVRREALEVMWPYLTGEFGNPSSRHELGERAAHGLADARARVAAVLGCRTSEVTFTAGGTEGANLAIKGLALGRPRGRHLLTTPIEHEAVLASADALARLHGFEVEQVAVDGVGRLEPGILAAALREDSTLVSVGYANNEIGTVQDVAALTAVAHERGALVHTDAVQAAGWLPLDVGPLGVDALSISGHKVGAPKGIGAVYLRGRLAVEPVIHGGGQERGRRSGTENVAGAVALATALELADAERTARADDLAALRDAFIARVRTEVPTAVLTGSPGHRLPNHASFCFPGTSGEAVLLELERRGVLVSSGSACAAGRDEPSHVLLAIGVDPDVASTAVRVTFGRDAAPEHVETSATAVAEAVAAVAG